MNENLPLQLQRSIEQTLQAFQTPGATVSVYINEQSFLEVGVGYQDFEQEIPLPTDASFYIYSITKSLLAIALLNLVQQRELNLDAYVRFYLPNFPFNSSITLRQLLSHTSGSPDYAGIQAYSDAVRATPSFCWSTQVFIDLAQTKGLQFSPGEGWAYSNIGYLFLRCVLEIVTGLSMHELLNSFIFRRLCLQKTFVPSGT